MWYHLEMEQLAALKNLKKEDLISFFDQYVKMSAPQRRTLSIQVYGSIHSKEYIASKSETPAPQTVRIEDIFSFRRSQPLYGSFKGGLGHMKL